MTRLVTGSVNTHIIRMDAVYFPPVLTDTDYEIRVNVSGYITESIFSHSFSFTEYSISFHFFNIFELEIHSSLPNHVICFQVKEESILTYYTRICITHSYIEIYQEIREIVIIIIHFYNMIMCNFIHTFIQALTKGNIFTFI